MDTLSVKQGKHLELAETFRIDKFIGYYVENGKETSDKKYGLLTIAEFYNDSIFTYFGKKHYYGLIDFFKVRDPELSDINYTELDGNLSRKKFLADVVPETDKQKVQKKNPASAVKIISPSAINTILKRKKLRFHTGGQSAVILFTKQ